MALTKAVDRAIPFHKIAELAANPEPFTVRVNGAPPACAIDGVRLLIVGLVMAGAIVNVELLDTVTLDRTVTVAVPCAAMRMGSTFAFNCVALTKNVTIGAPFHKIVELAANPEPFTVRVKADPPAAVVDGLVLVITGFTVGAAIVNVELLDTAPFVLTVTAAGSLRGDEVGADSPA